MLAQLFSLNVPSGMEALILSGGTSGVCGLGGGEVVDLDDL